MLMQAVPGKLSAWQTDGQDFSFIYIYTAVISPHIFWPAVHAIEALKVLYTIQAEVNLYHYHNKIY